MTVASASVYAVTVHATCEYAMGSSAVPKTVWKVGRATLTTVMSRIDMIAPRTTTPATLRTAASIFSGYVGASSLAMRMTPWSLCLVAAAGP
jgi:hypothetical protein